MESAELIAILREVRDQVRARHPETSAPGQVPLPDLLPLVHARDAALGKVASIGTVNPRAGGLANSLIQSWKKLIARVLDWHVRDQIVFNRKLIDCIDAALEALNQNNRAFLEVAGRVERVRTEFESRFVGLQTELVTSGNRAANLEAEMHHVAGLQAALQTHFADMQKNLAAVEGEAQQMKDARAHWAQWRLEWERKLQQNEMQFLRGLADLQGAFQHRATLMDSAYRETVRAQHADFKAELSGTLDRMHLEFEKLIYSELRLLRQHAALGALPEAPPAGSAPPPGPFFDYTSFAQRFRGSEEYVKAGQQIYLPYYAGRSHVLDIGCGRGEFLEMMRDAGIAARGIDLGAESVALCRQKGLEVEAADLFNYLAAQPEGSLDGIFCAQVVEHLPPERLPEMLKLAVARLAPQGVLAIETPNPGCLAIFATHFYLDPTHTRPVPSDLLVFYLQEFGVGSIEVKKLSPAVDSMPSLAELPPAFREAFFGGLDYAVIGRKL